VEPSLVGEVAYRTWTPDHRLRHASWRGLRPDKTPAEVVRPEPASPPHPGPPGTEGQAAVVGSMQTGDGAWRVDIMRRNRTQWYRVGHGDNVFDWLTIDAVQRLLQDAGIDLADLTETEPAA
jgi:bifunctional non-homologous end joining protein LigD